MGIVLQRDEDVSETQMSCKNTHSVLIGETCKNQRLEGNIKWFYVGVKTTPLTLSEKRRSVVWFSSLLLPLIFRYAEGHH